MSSVYYQNGALSSPPPPPFPTSEAAILPAQPPLQPPSLTQEEKLRNIVQKYEINRYFSDKMQSLLSYKIVFIFDDSGSMNTTLNDSPLNNPNNLFKATRWDELKYFAEISIEIASVFNENGCDIYFLNRYPSPVKNIMNAGQLVNYFRDKPQGFTPICPVMNQVLIENSPAVLGERKLLIILCTDGEPTNSNGTVDIPRFTQLLTNRPPIVFTNIICCTDDGESVGYLNRLDHTLPRLDIIDDFRAERVEIKKSKGSNFPFSFGDYVVKSLIGSIDPDMDNMDRQIQNAAANNQNYNNSSDDCCFVL